ncbi:MAG: preprotein translocase subunit SecE [Robiginitomaculum sp.]|nr:MAG: preprotein translocase subunit SecE [Robiginitomaculum sp.]
MANAKAKKGTNPIAFIREVRQEGRKVTWTTWNETLVTSIMVFIMVALASTFFFLIDLGFSNLVKFILSLGGQS